DGAAAAELEVAVGAVAPRRVGHHVKEHRPVRVDAAKALALHPRAEVGVVDADEEEVVPASSGLGGGAADEDGAAVHVVDVCVPVELAAVDLPVAPLPGDGLAEADRKS